VEAAAIVAFFRNEFEAEERAGFPRLSLVPDTNARRFLHYLRNIPKVDAELLKSATAKIASRFHVPDEHPIRLTDAESLVLELKASEMVQMGGNWQFMSLKLLKMGAGMSRSEHPTMKKQMSGFQMPDDVLRWLDGLTTCKATELRKLVKHAFASRFRFAPKNLGGGNWVYHRPDGSCPFEVEIDYGGTWGQQLRYSVRFGERRPGTALGGLIFETVLGAGVGDWDFITEATADRDVALLVDLVEYAASIPTRLA
jgi:hypothetical protein